MSSETKNKKKPCIKCKEPYTYVDQWELDAWCQNCSVKYCQNNLCTWSGNEKIDNLIKKIQEKANRPYVFFEWIPFERFSEIKKIGEGGFSTIYYANWNGGYLSGYNEETHEHVRTEVSVALKCLNQSQDISDEFLKEIQGYSISFIEGIVKSFGISQDPQTKNYIMVLEYMKGGNLFEYLKISYPKMIWKDKLNILYEIIHGLKIMHDNEIVHKDLHHGNVLMFEDKRMFLESCMKDSKGGSNDDYGYYGTSCETIDSLISDMGLIGPADKDSNDKGIYGVMSYIAPETFSKKSYTKAADIYSFGMIMYLIATGQLPFDDKDHDQFLMLNICKGIRPKFPKETVPELYSDLMKKCWNNEPSNRPTIDEISEIYHSWVYLNNLSNSNINSPEPDLDPDLDLDSDVDGDANSEANYSETGSNLESNPDSDVNQDFFIINSELRKQCEAADEYIKNHRMTNNNESRTNVKSVYTSSSLTYYSQMIDFTK